VALEKEKGKRSEDLKVGSKNGSKELKEGGRGSQRTGYKRVRKGHKCLRRKRMGEEKITSGLGEVARERGGKFRLKTFVKIGF